MSENQYDMIMIGSGIGTLAAASFLAREDKKRILIVERHFQGGGFTHEFKREKNQYAWDVGIHYIGGLEKGTMLRKVFDAVTDSRVDWKKMEEPFERFVYPDFQFKVYGNPEKYKADLIAKFPSESDSIEQYFSDIKKITAHFNKHMVLKLCPPSLESLVNVLPSEKPVYTTKDYLDLNFQDEKLKALLVSQWGDYGLPPESSSFAVHAMVAEHYLNGGYYPVGGAGKIFESVKEIVEDAGGKILLSRKVDEILIQDGKAIGVKVSRTHESHTNQSTDYFAPIVVSNAGAYLTYQKLVPKSVEIPFREDLKKFAEKSPKTSSITLYLGLKRSPEELGIKGENYWVFSSYDQDKIFSHRNDWLTAEDMEVPSFYLSFPSLKNPESKKHTADVITFTDYENFEEWKTQPWKKRGPEYEALKQRITDKLLSGVEKLYPGFKDLVEYAELSTPITNETMTGHFKGTIYGLPVVPERFDLKHCPWFQLHTPVEGLYLVGADAAIPGISPSMMSGFNLAMTLTANRKQMMRNLIGKKEKVS